MPAPLPKGKQITVERGIFPQGYEMQYMAMANDHYNIGYSFTGNRRTITPTGTYNYHGGNVTLMPPFIYHRTVEESPSSYDRILIKYSPEFAAPFIEKVGQQVYDELYEKRVFGFSPEVRMKVEALFTDMEEEYRKERPYKEFILQGMLFRILAMVWEEGTAEAGETHGQSVLTPPIVDAISYIENYYYRNPSLEETARAVNFSASYFSRVFHAQLGKSYSEYLNHVKLRHVSTLLSQTKLSVMEIAQETGYCHGNYLSEQFKKEMGMTPGQFRKYAVK